jgi:hypothetical protein
MNAAKASSSILELATKSLSELARSAPPIEHWVCRGKVVGRAATAISPVKPSADRSEAISAKSPKLGDQDPLDEFLDSIGLPCLKGKDNRKGGSSEQTAEATMAEPGNNLPVQTARKANFCASCSREAETAAAHLRRTHPAVATPESKLSPKQRKVRKDVSPAEDALAIKLEDNVKAHAAVPSKPQARKKGQEAGGGVKVVKNSKSSQAPGQRAEDLVPSQSQRNKARIA